MTPREEILDIKNVEDAWQKEQVWRIEQKSLETTRPATTTVARIARTAPDFSFVADKRLRHIVERDYLELERIKGVGATLSRMVLAGRLIEGLLLDAMKRHHERASLALKAPKDKNGKVRDLENWDLSNLIDVALELGFLRARHEKQSHGVREFRNLVHPGWELRSELVVREEEANIAEQFLHIVILDLPERSQ